MTCTYSVDTFLLEIDSFSNKSPLRCNVFQNAPLSLTVSQCKGFSSTQLLHSRLIPLSTLSPLQTSGLLNISEPRSWQLDWSYELLISSNFTLTCWHWSDRKQGGDSELPKPKREVFAINKYFGNPSTACKRWPPPTASCKWESRFQMNMILNNPK